MKYKFVIVLVVISVLVIAISGNSYLDCPKGHFGEKCGDRCHCLSECDQVSGNCSVGCIPGYEGFNCQKLTGPAIITSVPRPTYTHDNTKSVSIFCTAGGTPAPSIKIKNINGLSDTDLQAKTTKEDLDNNLSIVNYTFILPVKNNSNIFMFTCEANNVIGIDTFFIEVSPIAPPVLKNAPVVQDVTPDSINLTWTPWTFGVDEGGAKEDVIEYQPCYRPLGHEPWSFVSEWTNETTATIENLWPDTEYQVAVRCSRISERLVGGIGEPGASRSATTKCDKPDSHSEPLHFGVILVGNDSAILSWQAPKVINLKCKVDAFILTIIRGVELPETVHLDNQKEEYVLKNLTTGNHYHVVLRVGTKFPEFQPNATESAAVRFLGTEVHLSFEAGDPETVKLLNFGN